MSSISTARSSAVASSSSRVADAPASFDALQALFTLSKLRAFIEMEAELLDTQRFDDWLALFAADGVYWVPAKVDQQSYLNHVSIFYDDRHTLGVRVQRLNHSMLHCQQPKSQCIRVVSNVRVEDASSSTVAAAASTIWRVQSKFIMIEDRTGAERRLYGGRYIHDLRVRGDSFEIVLKRVDLTNCNQSFPLLSQPF